MSKNVKLVSISEHKFLEEINTVEKNLIYHLMTVYFIIKIKLRLCVTLPIKDKKSILSLQPLQKVSNEFLSYSLRLKTLYTGDNITDFYNIIGYSDSIRSLNVGKNVKDMKIRVISENLEEINVSTENTEFASSGGVLFSKYMSTLLNYTSNKNDSNYTIPETVTSLEQKSFGISKSRFLKTITISNTVTYIPNEIFNRQINLEGTFSPFSLLYDVKILVKAPNSCFERWLMENCNHILLTQNNLTYDFCYNNGWTNRTGSWQYYKDGQLVTGWILDGHWYFIDGNGNLVTSWLNNNEKWYYLCPDRGGAMATSWFQNGVTRWFYANSSGAIQTGWLWDGAWYFLDSDGIMLADTYTPNGYYVGTDGRWAALVKIDAAFYTASVFCINIF